MRARTWGSAVAVLISSLAGAGCLGDITRGNNESRGSRETAPAAAPSVPMFAPELGETVRQGDPPPPISGGTLAMAGGGTVVAADPDRDVVYVVDVGSKSVRTVALEKHDEPGRVVTDGVGHAFVVLRRSGAVAAIDLAAATLVSRREVCPAPRGIAYDAAEEAILVACAGGDLVTMPALSGEATSSVFVRRDLRDVVLTPGGIYVTTFRDAEVMRLSPDKTIVATSRYLSRSAARDGHVAWRMIASPDVAAASGGQDSWDVVVAQQNVPTTFTDVPAEYYASTGGCGALGPLTVVRTPGGGLTVPAAVLPVDVAVGATHVALVSAANAHTPTLPTLVLLDKGHAYADPCNPGVGVTVRSQLTSVVYAPDGYTLYALSREPAALFVFPPRGAGDSIPLSTVSREDTGHAVFHSNSGAGIACASCHPEGRDDGHAWLSRELGARRTPSLVGTVAGTAPYHWNGEAKDMHALAQLTFASRMRGPSLRADQTAALDGWLTGQPALRPTVRDSAAATRGEAVFASSTAHCSACHAGTMRTDNSMADVGTGGAFQIPSLVGVSFRPPYFHDGRKPSLRSVVESNHGTSGGLSPAQREDLLVFLETL